MPCIAPPARARRRAEVGADAAVWFAIVSWTAGWAWLRRSPSGISWHYFTAGARLLLHGEGVHLYAHHPELQIGPLTFLAVAPLTALPPAVALAAAQVLMTAALPAALWLIAPLVGGPPGRARALRLGLAALVLAPPWTVLSVRWAHPDDVLALLLTVAAVRLVAGGRSVAAGTALAAAIGCKPWAVGFVPIVAVLGRRAAVRALMVTAAGLLASWGPFLLGDSRTLAALRPPVGVADSVPLRLLGYRGALVPAWTRTAQLLAAPLAALLSVGVAAGRRWTGAPLAAVAVRLALDPQDIAYYAAGAVLAAALFDLLATCWSIPWTALITSVALWQPFVPDFAQRFSTAKGLSLWWFQHPSSIAVIHLGWAIAALVVVLLLPARFSDRSAAPRTP